MAGRDRNTITLTPKALDSRIRRAAANALEKERSEYPHRFTELGLTAYRTSVRADAEMVLREEFARELAEKEAAARADGEKGGATDVSVLIAAALARVETLRPRDVPGLALLAAKLRQATLPADPSADVGSQLIGDILGLLWRVETD